MSDWDETTSVSRAELKLIAERDELMKQLEAERAKVARYEAALEISSEGLDGGYAACKALRPPEED